VVLARARRTELGGSCALAQRPDRPRRGDLRQLLQELPVIIATYVAAIGLTLVATSRKCADARRA
jgi:hypothetical protein